MGLPGPARVRRLHGVAADDLVHRRFHRLAPNRLWVTDITEHPVRESNVFCFAVMDTYSKKIVDWSIDTAQDTNLFVNTLDMAIRARKPAAGGIVTADNGTQFTSWAFTNKDTHFRADAIVQESQRLLRQLDDGIVLVEHANRIVQSEEVAHQNRPCDAMFEYIEVLYIRQRCHSKLGYLAPIEYELHSAKTSISA